MSNDMISKLSDDLLCHILSFLPTKKAVATSILSKRWSLLWRSTSTLIFNDEGHNTQNQNQTQHLRFVEFVYSVLISRDLTQPIETFALYCYSQFTRNSNINKWVNHAIQVGQVKNLGILNLQQGGRKLLFMPPSIFSCKTIVRLRLSGLNVNDFSCECVCLPSLKHLELDFVRFANTASVAKLLSGVTLVEHLFLMSVSPGLGLGNKDCLQVFPKLTQACLNFDMPWKPLIRAKFLGLTLDSFSNYRDVPTFSNLVHIVIVLFSFDWKCVIDILNKSPKLQILVLRKERTYTSNSNEMVGHFVTGSTTRFPSNLKTCHMEKFDGQECELQFAKYVMENATALTLMKISYSDASNSYAKHQMAKILMSYKRISPDCQLVFE